MDDLQKVAIVIHNGKLLWKKLQNKLLKEIEQI
uniref:Uncharacterized protein n=1 Tax=Rhizophora mucronata TaxID=61149 RepID=A0A2P2P6Z6_RHIMU